MAESHRKALVVVTSRYGDGKLTALRAPPQDAVALAEVLGNPAIGGFDVETLADPSCQELREKVEEFFADRASEHTLLLHFSCHGVKDSAGTLFLATMDTRCDRLASTAVPAEYVSSLMLASRARRAVVVLDCCYAGAFERGLLTRADTDAHVGESFQNLNQISDSSQRGRAVLAACSAVQSAGEGPPTENAEPAQPSYFTRSVVKGLRSGDADLDGNGEIGVSELHQYVCDELRELTPHQTPGIWVFGAHGRDLPIARAPARQVRPVLLPEKLLALVHSLNPADRFFVIDDLESIAQGDGIGLALTAVTTLDDLMRDDSRRVADRAERVRRSLQPRIGPNPLDLGTAATVDSLGPSAVITVEGPPVVHTKLEATTDAPWLTAEPVADGGEIRVKANRLPGPGNHTGNVLVRTATGEAAVQVRVRVESRVQAKTAVQVAVTPPVTEPPGKGVVVPGDWPPPPRKPPRRVPHWPFTIAALLLMAALWLMLGSTRPGWYFWSVFQGGSGLLVWPGLLLSLVTNAVLALRARTRAAVLGRPSVFWSYAGLTALNTLGTAVALIAYNRDNPGYEYSVPLLTGICFLLPCACVAQLAGCAVLHRAGRAVTQGTSRPPRER
ncbi:caspase family protein [Streptomyces sp. KS 21]|uniref:caspase family protein n=1 Tax=Streptomyces sp. KS 21 TaxID=2485150 RepID=UPI0010EA1E7C|nr:caspase family protein [Streptomyces sp. KS 21]TDU77554.1 caspase domain-containing protein [Streptomyces sp. KS 21]